MRGKRAPKRVITPDEVYNSIVVSKFINNIMIGGKKNVASTNMYNALEELAKISKEPALTAFEKALANAMPKIEIRARRVGGANYQVPTPVRPERQQALAMRWIISAARKARKTDEFYKALARELFAALKGEGSAVRKKEDVQKMAEANRAFAQYDVS